MNNIKVAISEQLTLNYIRQSKFKNDYLAVLFSQNLDDTYASYNAVLFNVLLSGSKELPNIRAINDRLNDMYGANLSTTNAKRGDVQEFGLVMSMLGQKYTFNNENILSEAFDTLKEIIFNPLIEDEGFKSSIFEIEKQNQIDAIEADINNKIAYARKRCITLMCKDEVFGINSEGDIDVIKNMDRVKLYEHYKRILLTLPMNIYYIGNSDINTVTELVKEKFSTVCGRPTKFFNSPITYSVLDIKDITEETQAAQGKLSLGFRTGVVRKDSDYAALCMANAIFGMAPTSKLFANVREKLSLCYYCRSELFAFRGIMLVSSGIEVENRERAQSEILAQLESVKNNGFTDEDISLARKYYINGLRSGFDSVSAMLSWCAAENLDGTDFTQDEFIDKINAVTREDIVRVSKMIKLDTVYFLKGTADNE